MHVSDASQRAAALAMPAAYLGLATASVALSNGAVKPTHHSLWLRR